MEPLRTLRRGFILFNRESSSLIRFAFSAFRQRAGFLFVSQLTAEEQRRIRRTFNSEPFACEWHQRHVPHEMRRDFFCTRVQLIKSDSAFFHGRDNGGIRVYSSERHSRSDNSAYFCILDFLICICHCWSVLPAHWTRLNCTELEIELMACLEAGERFISEGCHCVGKDAFLIDKIGSLCMGRLSQIEWGVIFVEKQDYSVCYLKISGNYGRRESASHAAGLSVGTQK